MATILIVDDVDTIHTVVRRALRHHTLIHAYSATDALDKLGAHEVDLMVLDLNLPDMSGFDLLDHLRDHDGVVTTVMISSEFSKHHVTTAHRKGARAYWEKCADTYTSLAGRITDLLSHR